MISMPRPWICSKRWWRTTPGTLLLVSHDRAFLDNVVTSTLVFEGRGASNEYVGGYTRLAAPAPGARRRARGLDRRARRGAAPGRAGRGAQGAASCPTRSSANSMRCRPGSSGWRRSRRELHGRHRRPGAVSPRSRRRGRGRGRAPAAPWTRNSRPRTRAGSTDPCESARPSHSAPRPARRPPEDRRDSAGRRPRRRESPARRPVRGASPAARAWFAAPPVRRRRRISRWRRPSVGESNSKLIGRAPIGVMT